MRLINNRTYEVREFSESIKSCYAILSHTWVAGEEVEYADLPLESTTKPGKRKIIAFCSKALSEGLDWAWIDTCCINKVHSTELMEAINSMYHWYQEASVCFAYLGDLSPGRSIPTGCRWFGRGWTLRELIAPRRVDSFDQKWNFVGTKSKLLSKLRSITKICRNVLAGAPPSSCSVAQRMSWAANRKTDRIEDRAYSLFGLFDITIPMQYGDRDRAFILLQEQIISKLDDETIFAWGPFHIERPRSPCGLLAKSPDDFENCQDIVCSRPFAHDSEGFSITNRGLRIQLYARPYAMHTYLCMLQACYQDRPRFRVAILLERLGEDVQYARVAYGEKFVIAVNCQDASYWSRFRVRSIAVRQAPHSGQGLIYGFYIRKLRPYLPVSEGNIRVKRNCDSALVWTRASGTPVTNAIGVHHMPPGGSGTVAVVYIPSEPGSKRLVWWLKLGFDDKFNPICTLGNSASMWDPGSVFCRKQSYVRQIKDTAGGTRRSLSRTAHENMFSDKWFSKAGNTDLLSDHRPAFRIFICHLANQATEVYKDDGVYVGFKVVPRSADLRTTAGHQYIWAFELDWSGRKYAGIFPKSQCIHKRSDTH